MRVALKFAYNGRNFSGYARQPGQQTIEQTLLDVLIGQMFFEDVKTSCFRTASRTDKGVSALGNVCAFDTLMSSKEVLRGISKNDSEIFLYGVHEVTADFYPRHAKQRQYRYYLLKQGLDVDFVLSAAGLFTGEHNFQNFARIEPLKNPVRVIDTIILSETKQFFILDFYAQTFLWNQIRRIVSAIRKAGEGTLSLQQILYALDHPEKKVDFQVAPSEPLLLMNVKYDFSFDYIKDYKKKLLRFEKNIISSLC